MAVNVLRHNVHTQSSLNLLVVCLTTLSIDTLLYSDSSFIIVRLLEATWKEAIWNYFVALSRYLAGRNEKKSRTVPGCPLFWSICRYGAGIHGTKLRLGIPRVITGVHSPTNHFPNMHFNNILPPTPNPF